MNENEDGKPTKLRYTTSNWRAYNQAPKTRGSLSVWLDKYMSWFAAPTGKRGRCSIFSDAAVQFCLSIKSLFGLALRQMQWFVQSLLRLADLPWPVPDYSPLSRCQKTLRVQLHYRPSTTALDWLVASTGVKFLGEGEWKRKKHGAEYRRQWRKVHMGIEAHTLEIRAIKVTDNSVGDAPMLSHLLGQIPTDEKLASVSSDGVYDTKACLAAVVQRGAQAVIPPRKNAQLWKDTSEGAQVRNQAVRACQRLGSLIWKKMEWLPQATHSRDQNALFHPTWVSCDGSCGINPSGVLG